MRIDEFQTNAVVGQVRAAGKRYQDRRDARERNEKLISERRFLAVDEPERVKKFLKRQGFSVRDAEAFVGYAAVGIPAARDPVAGKWQPYALERMLGTNDLIGVAFLERGLQVARSVGRILIGISGGRPLGYGTGFLISPALLMTNNHVLETAAIAGTSLVEFNYQIGLDGVPVPTTSFALDPNTFFFTDHHLDYTVVAVRPTGTGGRQLASFGWNPVMEEQGKAIVSQWLNIIQHPNGEPKQLGLRENQLVDLLDDFLHYKTDTAPGSSGSPVYNDRWEVVGLHHSGVWATDDAGHILTVDGQVWDPSMGEDRIKWIANEGVRISRIFAHLASQPMSPGQRQLFEQTTNPPPASGEQPSERAAAVAPQPDGATVTIPLSISLRFSGATADLGPIAAQLEPTRGADRGSPVAVGGAARTLSEDVLQSILAEARQEFARRPEVLGVRLGYVFKNGWITDERAVVVTVRQKRSPEALREVGVSMLPAAFRGLALQVTGPTIDDIVKVARGPTVAEAAFAEPGILREEIKYLPPAGAALETITDTMRVVAHVSPDAGWSQLSKFLAGTRKQLIIGMFDFGAPHITDAVEAAGRKPAFNKLTLVMQPGESVGEGTKADDLRDAEVVERLSKALRKKFENTWVKIGKVNGWVASSYHIKVAVRDDKAIWLSSGNWQSSNQPDADPLSEQPWRRTWLDRYNREWHAIVEHPGLAKTYAKFLIQDFEQNRGVSGEEALALPDVLVPEAFFLPSAEERATPFQYFKPFDETRRFTVTPLLTPDNYHEHVLNLVNGASQELLIQNQTFNAPKDGHDYLRELIDAVIAKQRAGVKVRIIFRVLMPAKARQVLEDLKSHGLDVKDVRVQRNCHTKGIVVDSEKVLLGSQNWSNDGVSMNRDASLLFDDAPLAQYFARIFNHDWQNLARTNIGSEWLAVEWAPADRATPAGMTRLSWKDYMEML